MNEPPDPKLYWRLFSVRFVLYSLIQLGLAWKVSTGNLPFKDLSLLSASDWVGICVDMLVIWGGTMLALFDQTISRVAKGQLPINGNPSDTTPPFPVKK